LDDLQDLDGQVALKKRNEKNGEKKLNEAH
jgi:hypothetical protein